MIAARIHAVEPSVDIVDYVHDGVRAGALEVPTCRWPAWRSRLARRQRNARYVLDVLDRAIAGCQSGEFAGHGHRAGTRASSAMPACLFPATPNISPKRPARRWSS